MRRDPIQHLDTNSAMFVFTPAEPTAAIAYILPTATYHAYNFTGGGCFYNYPDVAGYPTLTLRRPGGGIGGECREARDPYDDGSPRQCFFHWDAKMLRWLRRNGFAVDCHADLDLDRRDFLTGYRLMVSGGHYEYWSDAMRTRFQRFLDGGGNAAIFGGNTCYRKISLDAAAGSITRENLAWPNSNEAELVGVSYSHGGGWWGDRHNGKWSRMDRPAIGYTAAAPDHWAFDGVDLSTHTTFGAGDRLIGYECDGVVPNVSPANLTVLANALLQGGWNNGNGNSASMVAFPSGRGAVFNAATTDWPRILGDVSGESYGAVSQITYNVVRKLSAARTE